MGKKETASRIIEVLKTAKHEAYLTGGCVRDMLMGREPEDFDVATSARPEEVRRLFEKTVPVGEKYGVITVLEGGGSFQVATFRMDGPYRDGRTPESVRFSSAEEDVLRRDFTVNGLLLDTETEKVLDFVNGRKDIEGRLVRAIGDPRERFREDRLRLLRAVRFAVTLGFEIEEETFQALRDLSSTIASVSAERIRDELVSIFASPQPGRGLDLLKETGLLSAILPEVEAMEGVPQPPDAHPEGDVFTHTLIMMGELRNPSPLLAFSVLLHDVGKPGTFEIDRGRIRFRTHEKIGAEIAREILGRLRFPKREIRRVAACVENHMRLRDAPRMREAKLKRLFARETFKAELELHRVECAVSGRDDSSYRFLKERYEAYRNAPSPQEPLIKGSDLIALGVSEGPRVGKILREVGELHADGKLATREEALRWARKRLGDPA